MVAEWFGDAGDWVLSKYVYEARSWNTLCEWDDAKDIRDKASALASAANVVATACCFRTPRGSQVINVAQAVAGVAHSVRDMLGVRMSPFTAEACVILFDTRAKERAEREERIKSRAKRLNVQRER